MVRGKVALRLSRFVETRICLGPCEGRVLMRRDTNRLESLSFYLKI